MESDATEALGKLGFSKVDISLKTRPVWSMGITVLLAARFAL
jgi:hypothetical protein